jgi:putative sigma-54 modulation protein
VLFQTNYSFDSRVGNRRGEFELTAPREKNMINIRLIGVELTAETRESLESRLAQALSCFGRRIQKVNAFFSDLNGPKGGVDKLCRVVVHLKRQPTLVIEDRDSELSHLIDRVIDRVGQTAARVLERRRSARGKTSA